MLCRLWESQLEQWEAIDPLLSLVQLRLFPLKLENLIFWMRLMFQPLPV